MQDPREDIQGAAYVDEEDADSRKSGGQPESEKDGEVGGVWIVGHVEKIKEEEETREDHALREVEEGTARPGCRIQFRAHVDRAEQEESNGRLGCRSKCWASQNRRDELIKTHGDQRDEMSKMCEVREVGFVQKPKRMTCKR